MRANGMEEKDVQDRSEMAQSDPTGYTIDDMTSLGQYVHTSQLKTGNRLNMAHSQSLLIRT